MNLQLCLIATTMASVSAFTSIPLSKTTTEISAVKVDEYVGYYIDPELKNEGLTNLPGDQGFDPFEFSKTQNGMFWMRESEIKHCRLAMLAAAGWPLAEIFDRPLANLFQQDVIVDAADRNPSALNGGLAKISPVYWVGILTVAAFIDLYQINKANQDPNYKIGDLGFDPLGFYPKGEKERFIMETKEISNGRLAMVAIAGFAAQEFVTQVGVVDQTPFFFKPIGF